MHLPRSAARYITLQRLETQGIGRSIHYSALGTLAYRVYERSALASRAFRFYSSRLEPRFRAGKILADYRSIMAAEFATIEAHLPPRAERIVGIGAGVAGLEVFICRWYRERTGGIPKVVLIDKTGIDDDLHFGFHEKPATYNSLETATEVLRRNGVAPNAISAVDAEHAHAWARTHPHSTDLVTSLIAWGFHFPVAAYRDFCLAVMKPEGALIIDVRKGTSGRAELAQAFGSIEVLVSDPKFDRVLCREPRRPHAA